MSFLNEVLFPRKSLLIWTEMWQGLLFNRIWCNVSTETGAGTVPKRWRKDPSSVHFLPPLSFFRFLFQPLYLIHLQFSNKWRLSHEMYELSQYKIALDKGIIPPSITTLTTTDPAQGCSPSEWTMSFRKLFFNYYNKWFFK